METQELLACHCGGGVCDGEPSLVELVWTDNRVDRLPAECTDYGLTPLELAHSMETVGVLSWWDEKAALATGFARHLSMVPGFTDVLLIAEGDLNGEQEGYYLRGSIEESVSELMQTSSYFRSDLPLREVILSSYYGILDDVPSTGSAYPAALFVPYNQGAAFESIFVEASLDVPSALLDNLAAEWES